MSVYHKHEEVLNFYKKLGYIKRALTYDLDRDIK